MAYLWSQCINFIFVFLEHVSGLDNGMSLCTFCGPFHRSIFKCIFVVVIFIVLQLTILLRDAMVIEPLNIIQLFRSFQQFTSVSVVSPVYFTKNVCKMVMICYSLHHGTKLVLILFILAVLLELL